MSRYRRRDHLRPRSCLFDLADVSMGDTLDPSTLLIAASTCSAWHCTWPESRLQPGADRATGVVRRRPRALQPAAPPLGVAQHQVLDVRMRHEVSCGSCGFGLVRAGAGCHAERFHAPRSPHDRTQQPSAPGRTSMRFPE